MMIWKPLEMILFSIKDSIKARWCLIFVCFILRVVSVALFCVFVRWAFCSLWILLLADYVLKNGVSVGEADWFSV